MGYTKIGDPYHHPGGSVTTKFHLKDANYHGISVADAPERVRLSQGNTYLKSLSSFRGSTRAGEKRAAGGYIKSQTHEGEGGTRYMYL